MARPTDCTPEITAIIADVLRKGATIRAACAKARIAEKTYYEWIVRGDAREEPYATFSETIKGARADGELDLVAKASEPNSGLAGVIFLLKASHGYRDSEPVQVIQPQPAGPTPGTPEHEAALIEALAAKPDLLRRAVEAAEKRGQK